MLDPLSIRAARDVRVRRQREHRGEQRIAPEGHREPGKPARRVDARRVRVAQHAHVAEALFDELVQLRVVGFEVRALRRPRRVGLAHRLHPGVEVPHLRGAARDDVDAQQELLAGLELDAVVPAVGHHCHLGDVAVAGRLPKHHALPAGNFGYRPRRGRRQDATHAQHGREVRGEHQVDKGAIRSGSGVGEREPVVEAAGEIALEVDVQRTRGQLEDQHPCVGAEACGLGLDTVDQHPVVGQIARVIHPDAMPVGAVVVHRAVAAGDREDLVLFEYDPLGGEEVFQGCTTAGCWAASKAGRVPIA